nr:hypothetical protein [Tanacetum cinerariifolium]
MEQPEGFVDPDHPRKVCKLQRSIYGLKQASRSWNKRFDEEIKKFGFHQNLDEPCVYQKASGSNVIFLILYVDDIIFMRNHKPSLQEIKDYLDLGDAAYILGIKIYRDRSRRLIGLSQDAYLDKILKRYKMDDSKRGAILMQVDCHLDKSQCAKSKDDKARMQNSPGEAHWTTVKNILKYLRRTKDMFLVYDGNSDAGLQVKFVWKNSKQSTTAQHAAEAEYIAAAEAAKEAAWIRKFVDELGIVPSNNYPIEMSCDNTAAISMAKEPGIMKGARHFQRKFHYVRECVETVKIEMVKVNTDDHLADPFTKALAGPKLTVVIFKERFSVSH